MFSICFQPDQGLFTDTRTKMEKISTLPMPDPRTKTSDQLVGIADYMGTSLEANVNHTMQIF